MLRIFEQIRKQRSQIFVEFTALLFIFICCFAATTKEPLKAVQILSPSDQTVPDKKLSLVKPINPNQPNSSNPNMHLTTPQSFPLEKGVSEWDVRNAFERQQNQLQTCWINLIRRQQQHPPPKSSDTKAGTLQLTQARNDILVNFEINSSGRAQKIQFEAFSTHYRDAVFESCLKSTISRINLHISRDKVAQLNAKRFSIPLSFTY